MSLRFAILTALAERESTGIELARRFDRSIGYFWTASHQQIYRELERLSAEDLVTEAPLAGPPRRGQPRSFAITGAGRLALADWTALTDDAVPPTRDAALVRLRAAAAMDAPELAVATLRAQLGLHQERLQSYRAIEERDFAGDSPSVATRIQHLILRSGIEAEESRIAWCCAGLRELGAG